MDTPPGSHWQFRPRLVTTAAAVAFCALTVSLGNWQLRRADENEATQRLREERTAAPATRLPGGLVSPEAWAWRRVEVRGEYSGRHTILLDNRVREGRVGYEVLTPLRLEASGLYVLVDRGWVPAGRTRGELPAVRTPPGVQAVEGIATAPPARVFELGDSASNGAVWQHLQLDRYREWSGLTLQPLVVVQTSDAPDGLLRRWERPATGADKNRAYALQWYTFALLTVILYVGLNFKRVRHP